MQQTLTYRNVFLSTTTTTTTIGGSSFTTTSESCSDVNNKMKYVGEMRSRYKNSFITTSVAKSVSEHAIIVVAIRGCCMCHVVKNLLLGLGVNPTIFEVNNEDEDDVKTELSIITSGVGDGGGDGTTTEFPAVFVGGNLFGGLERVISTHISGELVPILKDVGALWL
ncbi:glutaredoxin-C9-like isoform X2 [Solanum lycopersicum]|uniref:glutaredoxin-C9-like isoform X2 n=1 Tax=Solanum lycopersicum TaxID=4081 RepID=UPI000532B0B5|nr:glutaredoxin-C9-like isoform X2 [Solanum lycopersicum]